MGRIRKNIDAILRQWPYEPGEISVRLVRGNDGRSVLQMRLDMGLLQLETTNRPDGDQPGGLPTYFDHVKALAAQFGEAFMLTDEQCAEVDREFVQFYQRRLCWLALREFRSAVLDADHSLAMMDFVRGCSPNDEWTASHEQYRVFVLFHRTQALSLAELEDNGPEAAIEELNKGLDRIRQAYQHDAEDDEDAEAAFEEDELVRRLNELRETLRDHYSIGRTLQEQLADAVAQEQYELAAQLRDKLAKRETGR